MLQTTSTLLPESTYVRRRMRHLENHLAGAGKTAFHINRDMQGSLSGMESSLLLEEGLPQEVADNTQKSAVECSRGCPVALTNLAKTYQSVGTVGL